VVNQAAPKNGMHPTANSAALIEDLRGFSVVCAAGIRPSPEPAWLNGKLSIKRIVLNRAARLASGFLR
jgi:hypothetical protein